MEATAALSPFSLLRGTPGEWRPRSGPGSERGPATFTYPFTLGPIEIRPGEALSVGSNRRVSLTVREFQVLLALVGEGDRVLTRQEIYATVWGGAMLHRDRSVDVFVRKLRRKLEQVAPGWRLIHTHFGIGYRLSPERVDPPSPTPRADQPGSSQE